jgi:hypothetical protein
MGYIETAYSGGKVIANSNGPIGAPSGVAHPDLLMTPYHPSTQNAYSMNSSNIPRLIPRTLLNNGLHRVDNQSRGQTSSPSDAADSLNALVNLTTAPSHPNDLRRNIKVEPSSPD